MQSFSTLHLNFKKKRQVTMKVILICYKAICFKDKILHNTNSLELENDDCNMKLF